MAYNHIEFVDGFHVRIVLPHERLRRFITAYYTTHVESAEPLADYLFPEWGNLRIIYQGGWDFEMKPNPPSRVDGPIAQGPTSKPIYVESRSARMVGVGLLPAGFSRFWGVDVSRFANCYPPINDLLGASGSELATAIAEAECDDAQFEAADRYFLSLLDRRAMDARTQRVLELHRLLNDPDCCTVEEIMSAMQLSHARLARLCKSGFGFAPKLLLRRQRFLRMLGTLHSRPYEEWRDFVDPAYVDQSHMIRDFRYFLGLSPSQYLALPRPIQRPSVSQRAAVIGRPLQGLHKMGEND